jgi:serine/threonine-protein kinase RsbW
MRKTLRKTIQSRTDHLHEIREFIAHQARRMGFDDEESANIVLAVDEACTNVIKHAYAFAPDKKITVEIRARSNALEVRVLDNGKSFDPTGVKAPDIKQHLAEHRRGGLGIYMMKMLVDKVEYRFSPGKRNEVRLIKYLPKARTRAAG